MKLGFSEIISTVNKAVRVLGSIKRLSKEFDDLLLTKILCISLVRPILENESCISSSQYLVHKERTESVQKNLP